MARQKLNAGMSLFAVTFFITGAGAKMVRHLIRLKMNIQNAIHITEDLQQKKVQTLMAIIIVSPAFIRRSRKFPIHSFLSKAQQVFGCLITMLAGIAIGTGWRKFVNVMFS